MHALSGGAASRPRCCSFLLCFPVNAAGLVRSPCLDVRGPAAGGYGGGVVDAEQLAEQLDPVLGQAELGLDVVRHVLRGEITPALPVPQHGDVMEPPVPT